MRKVRTGGFTLIELMIAVVIVAILSAVALPSYQEHVRRTKRVECEAAMLKAASMLERYYSVNHRYGDGASKDEFPNAVASALKCPPDGGTATYDFGGSSVGADAFTLKAEPANAQQNDKCGTLTLDDTGAKGQAAGMTTADCWR